MDRSKHMVSIPVEDYEELVRDADSAYKYNSNAQMIIGTDFRVLLINVTDVQIKLRYDEVHIFDNGLLRRFSVIKEAPTE